MTYYEKIKSNLPHIVNGHDRQEALITVSALCLTLAEMLDERTMVNRSLRKRIQELNEMLNTPNTQEHD